MSLLDFSLPVAPRKQKSSGARRTEQNKTLHTPALAFAIAILRRRTKHQEVSWGLARPKPAVFG